MVGAVKKIPTLFVRDYSNGEHRYGRYVTPEVTPGCEWVLAGEGVPTRKFDGTCCMFDGERWWARREVKGDSWAPEGFVVVDFDPVTSKRVGWEPIENSGFARWHAEAVAPAPTGARLFAPGTYELIGPKVNGNPEAWPSHFLVEHGAIHLVNPDPITFWTLRDALTSDFRFEGIVWHHPDGRMAKLKKRDFPA